MYYFVKVIWPEMFFLSLKIRVKEGEEREMTSSELLLELRYEPMMMRLEKHYVCGSSLNHLTTGCPDCDFISTTDVQFVHWLTCTRNVVVLICCPTRGHHGKGFEPCFEAQVRSLQLLLYFMRSHIAQHCSLLCPLCLRCK